MAVPDPCDVDGRIELFRLQRGSWSTSALRENEREPVGQVAVDSVPQEAWFSKFW